MKAVALMRWYDVFYVLTGAKVGVARGTNAAEAAVNMCRVCRELHPSYLRAVRQPAEHRKPRRPRSATRRKERQR